MDLREALSNPPQYHLLSINPTSKPRETHQPQNRCLRCQRLFTNWYDDRYTETCSWAALAKSVDEECLSCQFFLGLAFTHTSKSNISLENRERLRININIGKGYMMLRFKHGDKGERELPKLSVLVCSGTPDNEPCMRCITSSCIRLFDTKLGLHPPSSLPQVATNTDSTTTWWRVQVWLRNCCNDDFIIESQCLSEPSSKQNRVCSIMIVDATTIHEM
jgi:hypothetical protein